MEDVITSYTYQFQNSPIWNIVLLNPVTKEFAILKSTEVTSQKQFYKENIDSEEKLNLIWKIPNYNLAVTVTIRLPQDSSLSYWDIKVENNNSDYSLWTVDFPYFDIPAFGGGDKDDTYLAITRANF